MKVFFILGMLHERTLLWDNPTYPVTILEPLSEKNVDFEGLEF